MRELWWSPTGNQVLFKSGSKYFRVGDHGHAGYSELPAGSVRLVPAVDRNADPEAWLADQLAQLPTLPDVSAMVRDGWGMTPGSAEFEAVQKLAQEYGEMCTACALADHEDLTIVTKDEGGLHVLVGGVEVRPLAEVFPDGGTALREMGAGPLAVVHGLDDDEVVR